MFYFTEDLVASAKRSEFFPIAQSTFTDPDDFIAYANEEIMLKLVPLIMSAREDYFLGYSIISLRSSVNHYPMPERATGNALKDVFYLADKTQITTRYPIPKTDVHDLNTRASITGAPSAFFLQGDEIVLSPTPGNLSGTEALQVFHFLRPSKLAPTSSCSKITSITVGATKTTLNVNTDLSAALSAGSLVDFLSAKSPFRLWARDVVIQSITSTQIVVNNSDIQDEGGTTMPLAGDYICPAQTTCIPQFPQEFHPIIAEMVCYRAMKALGATAKLQVVAQNIKDAVQGALKLISNRVESEPEVLYDSTGFAALNNFSGYSSFTR